MLRKIVTSTAAALLVAGTVSGALAATTAATGTTKTTTAAGGTKTAAVGTAAGAAASVAAQPKLGPADIQATFGTGNAFAGSTVGGATYSYVLKPDGTASRTAKGSKTAEAGTWRAADPGYCAKWGKGGTERCYSIRPTATTASYDVLDTGNKVVAHWTAKAP